MKNRLCFLQIARGIACLLIVYIHWLRFLHNPNGSADIVFQPAIEGYIAPSITTQIMELKNKILPFDFREVYFGLGLFFLISGFVIPLSMEKGTQIEFLIRRILRIYPVVIITTIMTSIILFLSQRYYNSDFSVVNWIKTTFGNMFLVRDVLHYQFVDPSLWTLEIEIHFYILCFFMGFVSLHKKATCLVTIAFLFCIAAYFGKLFQTSKMLEIFGHNGSFITLMLIGTSLFNCKYHGWSFKKTALVISVLFITNKYCLSHNFEIITADYIFANHVYVFLFFLVLLFTEEKIPYSKTLESLANISYPLYLVHGVGAYSIFFLIVRVTNSVLAGFLISMIEIAIITYLIHIYVENKGVAYSKKLIYKLLRK
ncbi:Acyltransferase family protein (plasmid) [Rickettsiales bacterium Ac37b]|nr:Acyltransferase family protein [Rickettsiales bacterium Ac37b]